MSSRFVSGGTVGPADEAPPDSAQEQPLAKGASWEAVQRELDDERRRKEEARRGAEPQQSLYDILQANKAAKQAAFEEANKLKNQFRPLDDDEVDFLDEVMAKQRGEEERVRRETEEGLKTFRARQKSGGGEEEVVVDEDWAAVGGRKRRRVAPAVRGVKRRNTEEPGPLPVETSKEDAGDGGEKKSNNGEDKGSKNGEEEKSKVGGEKREVKHGEEMKATKAKKGPSLVSYDSDDDDDDDDDE